MARRTKEEIQNNIKYLREYSGRLKSILDIAERLGISCRQVYYTLECMKVNADGKKEVE